jgi:hypothetical protein
LPGHAGGPGNPHGRQVAALRRTLLEVVTPERLRNVVTKLVEQAEAGCTASAKLVLLYSLGRPAEATDPDKVELAEMELMRAAPTSSALADEIILRMAPASAAACARHYINDPVFATAMEQAVLGLIAHKFGVDRTLNAASEQQTGKQSARG